jgi:lysophospholipase L1-like esterase
MPWKKKNEVEGLEELQSQMAQRPTISEVDSKVSQIVSGSPKGTYATLSALQTAFPTGTTGVYLVTSDGKWYYWNGTAWTAGGTYQSTGIANKTVEPLKTTFITLGKNLFDKYNQISGKLFSYLNGSLVDSASYTAMANYVPIEASTTYIRSGSDTVVVFFDANKTFISGVASGLTSFTTPTNAVYMKASVANTGLNIAQIEKGSTATAYESFNYSLSSEIKYQLPPSSVGGNELKPSAVTTEKLAFPLPIFQQTKNLFNKSGITAGYFVNQTNGQLVANSSHNSSDFILVSPSTQYSFVSDSSARIAYYDANKVFIIGAVSPTVPITTPSNCVFVRLSFPTSISIDSVQLEQGATSTAYVNYGFTSSNLITSDGASAPLLNLPSKLYGLVGQELNIYFDNIVSGHDYDYDFDVVCSKGRQYQNFWRFVPDVAETRPITINAYKNNELVASVSSNIVCTAASVGNGINKNIIKIGDSTTDNGNGIVKLNENFIADVMNITAIGTRGTSPNLHEGRSGWTSTDYCTISDRSGVNNAFWNPTTSKFDFSYYMTQNAFGVPNYVIINLGINDMFGFTDDGTLETGMINATAKYNEMIASIKAYNSSIKIGLGLTIPPNYSQDAFGKAYSSVQNRNRYKRNRDLWVKKLIETYDKRESENIYLVPIHTNLDTRYNMGLEETQVNARNIATFTSPVGNGGVHPVESGYWQIADVEWYFLKSFES